MPHLQCLFAAGLVGLAISYALSITNLLSGVVSTFTETEKQMVSVERANQYIEGVKPEPSQKLIQVSGQGLLVTDFGCVSH